MMAIPPPLTTLAPAQRERLAYIEFRLWFLGEVTRKDVLDRFGLATAAGTRDMALYQQLALRNAVYAGKAYRYLPSFVPLFGHDPQRVLQALTCGFGDGERSAVPAMLPHSVPARLNQPLLANLAVVTRAIHLGKVLTLTYYSMKTGPRQREIVPHALVDSGLRWHVRSYDRTTQSFRDLVLTRMDQLALLESPLSGNAIAPHERLEADEQWQRIVELNLIPHPGHEHPGSVERDFGMTKGELWVKLRAAAVGYVLRQWQVDCSPDASLYARDFRLRLEDLRKLDGVENAVLAPGYLAQKGQDQYQPSANDKIER